MDALKPWAGDPLGQELNSQGCVRTVAGASDEPGHVILWLGVCTSHLSIYFYKYILMMEQ